MVPAMTKVVKNRRGRMVERVVWRREERVLRWWVDLVRRLVLWGGLGCCREVGAIGMEEGVGRACL
jgi:hypothetical protein